MRKPAMGSRRLLIGALALGLALRLIAAFSMSQTPLVADELNYAAIATNIATRGEFVDETGKATALRTPMYPGFLALFVRLSPGHWSFARVAQAALDTTTILLVYVIGLRALRCEREAVVGAFLYALHPIFIAYSARILSETFFIWVWLLTVWLFLRAMDSVAGPARAAAAGVALGLTVLSRPNFMFFPPVLAAIVAALHDRRPAGLRRLLMIVVICYATVLPWTLRNRLVMGKWVLATGGGYMTWCGAQLGSPATVMAQWNSLYYQLSRERTELETDAEFYRLAKLDLKRNGPSLLKDLPRRCLVFWLTSHSAMFGIDQPLSTYRAQGRWVPIAVRAGLWAMHIGLLALGALGFWMMRRSWTIACTVGLITFAYYSLHALGGYWNCRYHLPALAFWLMFAAVPIVYAQSLLPVRQAPRA